MKDQDEVFLMVEAEFEAMTLDERLAVIKALKLNPENWNNPEALTDEIEERGLDTDEVFKILRQKI